MLYTIKSRLLVYLGIAFFLSAPAVLRAEWVWVEGEAPQIQKMTRHPWWYDQVKKSELSGGDFISNWSETAEGTAEYGFSVKSAGRYTLWLRANPVQTDLAISLNGAAPQEVDFAGAEDSVNLAADDKPDLRFVAWINAGEMELKAGANTLGVIMRSANNHHGMLDCFLVTNEPFTPAGKGKPGAAAASAAAEAGWRVWGADTRISGAAESASVISLRGLNEKFAGEQGRIIVKDGHFAHEKTGRPVRFWGVNGPPHDLKPAQLEEASRVLARYGVNLVRLHGAMFDSATGQWKPEEAEQSRRIVRAAAREGIYSHLSIYFPLWLQPKGDLPFLKGSAGKHPFASLYVNPDFQAEYQGWWRQLLTEPGEDGKRLIDDPAVMGLELVNEDSLFFWTFSYDKVPAPDMRRLEERFAQWAMAKYGSLEAALAAWKDLGVPQDAPGEGRLGFRPLWNMFTDKTLRDQDTATFLMQTQRGFYEEQIKFLRGLGFKGLITCSNWTTANNEILGPLEKYSYTVGDFMDRHGYFGGPHTGPDSAWSIREGHVFGNRSAYRFEGGKPGEYDFSHPVVDPKYNGLPSMISETAWTRPNAYRGEAPLFYAVYGALQGSDAIVHFAHDGLRWDVKPRFFMQPWTLMAPTQVGQFPAAAAIYRLGLVEPGEAMAEVNLNLGEIQALKGTPLVQNASLDQLREADSTGQISSTGGGPISPLIHYMGRVNVNISAKPASRELRSSEFTKLKDGLAKAKMVVSSPPVVQLDYAAGSLRAISSRVIVLAGELGQGSYGMNDLLDVELPEKQQIYLALVPMDGESLHHSKSMLLQVMTQEKPTGFTTESAGPGLERISSLGTNPWLVKEPRGQVSFKRTLSVMPLDDNGVPVKDAPALDAAGFQLLPGMTYYWVRGQ